MKDHESGREAGVAVILTSHFAARENKHIGANEDRAPK